MTMEKFHSKIVGSSFCNGQEIIRNLQQGQELLLIPEPTNKYDSQAVMVATTDKVQIGYVPKDTAHKIFEYLIGGSEFKTTVAQITGGTEDKPSFGCNILCTPLDAI